MKISKTLLVQIIKEDEDHIHRPDRRSDNPKDG